MGLSLRMEQSLDMRQKLRQTQKLSHTQNHLLKIALSLYLKLQDPSFPDAAKGYDGMIAADALLEERQARGVLIGGLASKAWFGSRNYRSRLSHSKDVDVLVLDSGDAEGNIRDADNAFALEKPFERGIDWWLPHTAYVRLDEFTYQFDSYSTWWQNANDVILNFRIKLNGKQASLPYGLLIPSPEWITGMRCLEACAGLTPSQFAELDEDVTHTLDKRFRKHMSERLPDELAERFQGKILHPAYMRHDIIGSVALEEQPRVERLAINEYMNGTSVNGTLPGTLPVSKPQL